jgi:NAD(P) transhydrogenase
VGGGVIAIEYASIFALLGIVVHLIARTSTLLPFVEREIMDALEAHLAEQGVVIHTQAAASRYEAGAGGAVAVKLGGEAVEVDLVLAATGRDGLAPSLNLDSVGLSATERGLLRVDGRFRTAAPQVLAVGDVIGFPSLASTARVQGRCAVRHLLGLPVDPADGQVLPFGIYTIPEMAFVGRTERELAQAAVPHVAGVARYSEVARGAISGNEDGLLKLLFHRDDRRLLGAHLFGASAAELIHLAQAVMVLGGGLDYFTTQVLNYPTLTECFRVAAFDAERRLRAGA